jgi:hypothetical protein
MFDSESADTFSAINEICSLAGNTASKPIVFWIGAGGSSWANLPRWPDLADIVHREFDRKEPSYDKALAVSLLAAKDFPAFFSVCKSVSTARYHSLLVQHLARPLPGPVHDRFIAALQTFKVTRVVTTNVDELLEQRLGVQSILPGNFELIPTLLTSATGFVAKAHGSIADVNSLVFTKEDYARLARDKSFLNSLSVLLQTATVLFIGYGLADEYVLDLISHADDLKRVFGNGPHFACLSDRSRVLPESVRIIGYKAEPHRDHRASILLIEEVGLHAKRVHEATPPAKRDHPHKILSAHMLSDVYPAGSWTSSQTCVLKKEDSDLEMVMYVGHGITKQELPLTMSTAMHDLVVGLLCFDRVYAPLSALGRIHTLVGPGRFDILTRADVLRFVRLRRTEAMLYRKADPELNGDVGTVSLPEYETGGRRELTLDELIRKQLQPVPGHEAEAEKIFKRLEGAVADPTPEDPIVIPQIVRSLLIRPSVREMLGISGGVRVNSIPKWVMFPILRLAQVVRLGVVCRELGLASIKFEFGSDLLAGPAFSGSFGEQFVGQLASYVLAGDFSTDLGSFITQNPDVLTTLLSFRDSRPGQQLRQEVFAALHRSDGGEVAVAINAALREMIPLKVIEAARKHFVSLSLVEGSMRLPAVWYDANYATTALQLWKNKAALELKRISRERGCGPYDLCLCGSGEKMRFCCAEALGLK